MSALRRHTTIAAGSLAIALAAGYGGVSTVGAAPSAPGQRDSGAASAAARRSVVRVRSSRYGRILVDAGGRTLYLFTHDAANVSHCSGACAQAWPPYLINTRAVTGSGGARAPFVGTIRRPGGALQVTYRGHPLYYYVSDRVAGQILCQDVEEFGGHWWVVSPTGNAVTGGAPPCKRPR